VKTLLCFLALFSFAFASAEETLYFESATKEETTRIVLYLSEGEVSGYQSWEVPEAHGTRGSLEGTLGDDGILRLVHRYTIEGADQAEEVVYKLDESGLLIGEGELVEDRDGLLRLKDPDKVKFTGKLSPVVVDDVAPGSPERKEIMESMRGPISAFIGSKVQFTGEVKTFGGWATFSGNVATADGARPKDEDAAFALELDFLALLKQDPDGRWQMLDWGFSGDISVREEFRGKYPGLPWVLVP
jgi:hypothetical protein